jgi:hypothetical protein
MVWYFGSAEPLTTERFRSVRTACGKSGWVSIRHVGGRPQPYGGVRDVPPGERWDSGEEVPGEILDPAPTFGLEHS